MSYNRVVETREHPVWDCVKKDYPKAKLIAVRTDAINFAVGRRIWLAHFDYNQTDVEWYEDVTRFVPDALR